MCKLVTPRYELCGCFVAGSLQLCGGYLSALTGNQKCGMLWKECRWVEGLCFKHRKITRSNSGMIERGGVLEGYVPKCWQFAAYAKKDGVSKMNAIG